MKNVESVKGVKSCSATTHPNGNGIQVLVEFENGYGASVVRFSNTLGFGMASGSYGHESGLWELAVMKDGNICYDTPITSDVLGWLSEEVMKLLVKISELEPVRK